MNNSPPRRNLDVFIILVVFKVRKDIVNNIFRMKISALAAIGRFLNLLVVVV